MAVQTFKAALNAAYFPFFYKQASRSVLEPRGDITPPANSGFVGNYRNVDYNIIQPLFVENVIPTVRGYMSVGFSDQLTAYSPAVTDFDQLILIRDSVNGNALFSPGKGKNYVYGITGVWTSYDAFTFTGTLVTKAYVAGRTLVCYEKTKVVEYDPAIPTVATRVLTFPAGYDITDIRGISGVSNYLIAFTDIEILWSTPTDILDLATENLGAGRQIPVDIKGTITCVLPISGGMLIYTTENVIAGFFTDNAAVPFRFKEVQNSGGVSSAEQVTGDATDAGHYCYGTAGLQKITLQSAQSVFPDCADFLVSKVCEFWNPVTKEIEETVLVEAFQPKLQYFGSRYLFISYGDSGVDYKFALVYDTVLERWGKFRTTHVDIGYLPLESLGNSFKYFTLDQAYDYYDVTYDELDSVTGQVSALRQNFGFLANTGAVSLLVAETTAETSGVLVLGHVQIRRGNEVTFQEMECEGLQSTPVPVITLLGSNTGYNRNSQYTPVKIEDDSNGYIRYQGRFTAKNFDIAFEGKFNFANLILETTVHGKR